MTPPKGNVNDKLTVISVEKTNQMERLAYTISSINADAEELNEKDSRDSVQHAVLVVSDAKYSLKYQAAVKVWELKDSTSNMCCWSWPCQRKTTPRRIITTDGMLSRDGWESAQGAVLAITGSKYALKYQTVEKARGLNHSASTKCSQGCACQRESTPRKPVGKFLRWDTRLRALACSHALAVEQVQG